MPRVTLAQGALELPAYVPHARQSGGGDALSFIGGEPNWLQNEDLELDGLAFAWQIDGGGLPQPLRDLFYLADGVGYLYVPAQAAEGIDRSGRFFVHSENRKTTRSHMGIDRSGSRMTHRFAVGLRRRAWSQINPRTPVATPAAPPTEHRFGFRSRD